jgi:HK97 gp10 family phage protein
MIRLFVTMDSQPLMSFALQSQENLAGFQDMLEDLLRESLDVVVAEAKENSPVRTGKLKESIRWEPGFEEMSAYILADATNEQGQGYTRYPEFGTSTQEAQYFVSGAVANQMLELSDKVREKLKELFYGTV